MKTENRIFKKLEEEIAFEDRLLLKNIKTKISDLCEVDKTRIENEIDNHIKLGSGDLGSYVKYLASRDFKENQRSL